MSETNYRTNPLDRFDRAILDILRRDNRTPQRTIAERVNLSPAAVQGSVRNFVCGRAAEHYAAMALMKRSPKMTANCALAMVHSRGGILHSFSDRFKIR
jgi:DNA-binding Lrp family transcriptional regulator